MIIISLCHFKTWLVFGDFDPFFKVTALPVGYLLNQLIIMSKIAWIYHKSWLDFGDWNRIFKVAGGLKYANILLKLIHIYLLNLLLVHKDTCTCTFWTVPRVDFDLVSLTHLSRSKASLQKMIIHIFLTSGWIFIKLAWIYHCNRFKTCLVFWTLPPSSSSWSYIWDVF